MSHITRLEVEKVMRVRSVKLAPKVGLNVLRGKNKAGKTTILRSIDFLFGGAKTHPPEVIALGEEKAQVIGETEDLIATRKWWRTPEGVKTELVVVAKDTGMKLPSPQAVLDKMMPPDSDPTAFFKLAGPARVDWLLKIIGVDPTLLDRKIDKVMEERKLLKRDLEKAVAQFAATSADAPPAKVDTVALQVEQNDLHNRKSKAANARTERDAAARRVTDAKTHVSACEAALRGAQEALDRSKAKLAEAEKHHVTTDNAVDAAEDEAVDVDAKLAALGDRIAKAGAIAAAHARWEDRARLDAEKTTLAADVEAKTEEIEKLRGEKDSMLAQAKFPVPGLGFGAGDVTFNGLPLEQASGAERIQIGAACITARNPRMQVLRVFNGNDLDEDNLAALEAFCDANDMQCFVEAAGTAGPATVIIRDGEAFEP